MKKPVELILLTQTTKGYDKQGNPIKQIDKRMIFADMESVRQSEFYQAADKGFKPELVFTMYHVELDKSDTIIYQDIEYSIIRTYQSTLDTVEVVCERKVGNK